MKVDDERVIYLEERRDEILSMLERDEVVRIADLSDHFHVSPATIRKDMRSLEQEGLIRRTHGGAIKPQQDREMGLEMAAVSAQSEKTRIGRAAASLVSDNDILFVQAGTTCRQFVRALKGKRNLTIFVNDFEIAMDIERILPDSQIIFLGGAVRQGYHYTHGTEAIRQLFNYRIPTAYMCTNAFDLDGGFSTHQLSQANWLQAQAQISERHVMLLDSTKFGISAPYRALGLEDIDCLVTDSGMDEQTRKALQREAPELEVIFS